MRVVEVGQYFVTKALVILDNFAQWLVANTHYLEMIQLLNQKDVFKEIWGLDLYWKSRPVSSTSNMELKFGLSPWIKTIPILGSEFPMERSNMWSILFKTTQKFLQIHKKSKFHKQARVWFAASSKAKAKPQQREPVDTPTVIPMHERIWIDIEPSKQNLASYDLSKKVINLLRHNQTLQREEDGAIEFYKRNFIFEIIIHKYIIGLMIDGKFVWLQEEVRKEDISIALIIREQFSTSVLFKDILETISLILRYRTMCWLELEYSLTFTT